MTVIATLINKWGTIHATDSLITIYRDNIAEPREWQLTKIVPVRAFRGAMSYWGLSGIEGQWSTLEWLRDQASRASKFQSAEYFARELASGLNSELSKFSFDKPHYKGIGIHFTAYEYISNRWIPELFLISNWRDTTYSSIRESGVGCSRETYKTLKQQKSTHEDSNINRRLEVAQYLNKGAWFRYNNGDPLLYNRAANAIFDMLAEMARRKILAINNNIESLIAIVKIPIEIISNIQCDFCKDGTRLVGGRIHVLAIKPNGDYHSTSGDEP